MEDRHRLEAEVSRMAIDLLKHEATKNEVSFLHSQAGKDKEALEEDF